MMCSLPVSWEVGLGLPPACIPSPQQATPVITSFVTQDLHHHEQGLISLVILWPTAAEFLLMLCTFPAVFLCPIFHPSCLYSSLWAGSEVYSSTTLLLSCDREISRSFIQIPDFNDSPVDGDHLRVCCSYILSLCPDSHFPGRKCRECMEQKPGDSRSSYFPVLIHLDCYNKMPYAE